MLSDAYNIAERIKKANQGMGALNFVWNASELDLGAKIHLYLAIPLNLLLWWCESWALTKALRRKIESCHHRHMRRILGLSWKDVRDQHITNAQVRHHFSSALLACDTISQQRLAFVGQVARQDAFCVPKKFLSAFIRRTRPVGRSNTTARHSILSDLHRILPSVDRDGLFSSWARYAADPAL